MQYGLIGERLGHSFSREIHAKLSSDSYELREISRGNLADFLQERDFLGINVTIPYKQAVMPYLDELDPSARLTGAVNTIVNHDGRLCGYNTDFYGFIALARHAGISFEGRRVVILGCGGAAKAVAAAARAGGAVSVMNAVRNPSSGAELPLEGPWGEVDILVNATPVGMYPDWQGRIVPPSALKGLKGVLDCIYNPLNTQLVLDAREAGVPAEGGLYMLVGQAVRAREFFCGSRIPDDCIEKIYLELLRSKKRIRFLNFKLSMTCFVVSLPLRRLTLKPIERQ